MSKYDGKYNGKNGLITKTEMLLFDILLELEKIADNHIELSIGEKENIDKVLKPKAICKHCGKTHDKPVDYANCGRKKKE